MLQRSTRQRAPGHGRTSSLCRIDATDMGCKLPSNSLAYHPARAVLLILACLLSRCPLIFRRGTHSVVHCNNVTLKYSYMNSEYCKLRLIDLSRGVRIIREGSDYYLIYQGEIQRYLGSRQHVSCDSKDAPAQSSEDEQRQISDRILFFLGDLEAACADAKRVKVRRPWYPGTALYDIVVVIFAHISCTYVVCKIFNPLSVAFHIHLMYFLILKVKSL